MQNQQYILVYGNVADGLTFLGPYSDAEAAADYAEDHLKNEHWDVIELNTPPTLEEFEESRHPAVRVVMPKAGGVPMLQFWDRNEEGEPRVRSDWRTVTNWIKL